jgi:hypothetical protein
MNGAGGKQDEQEKSKVKNPRCDIGTWGTRRWTIDAADSSATIHRDSSRTLPAFGFRCP